MKFFTYVLGELLDLFFPRACLGCGFEGGFLCENCEKQLDDLKPRAELSTEFLDKVFIACEYESDNLIGKMIKQVKYKFSEELSERLAEIVVRNLGGIVDWNGAFIPVPLSNRRLKWRGFNQSELIGELIVKIANEHGDNLKFATKYLRKIRETAQQAECKSKAERVLNLRNAFEVDGTEPPPETVILFDDIYTTGTTMNECAKVLKNSGVKKVFGLVIAKKTGSVV